MDFLAADPTTGEKIDTFKFGVSGGKVRLDGKSVRAEKQVRALSAANPGKAHESQIVAEARSSAGGSARENILEVERTLVKQYKNSNGVQPKGNTLPMVK